MPGGRPMQQWEEANAWRSAILRTNKQQNPLAGRRGFVLRGQVAMDANSGEPWSEMDIADLAHSLAIGQGASEVASFLCWDEPEVGSRPRGGVLSLHGSRPAP